MVRAILAAALIGVVPAAAQFESDTARELRLLRERVDQMERDRDFAERSRFDRELFDSLVRDIESNAAQRRQDRETREQAQDQEWRLRAIEREQWWREQFGRR